MFSSKKDFSFHNEKQEEEKNQPKSSIQNKITENKAKIFSILKKWTLPIGALGIAGTIAIYSLSDKNNSQGVGKAQPPKEITPQSEIYKPQVVVKEKSTKELNFGIQDFQDELSLIEGIKKLTIEDLKKLNEYYIAAKTKKEILLETQQKIEEFLKSKTDLLIKGQGFLINNKEDIDFLISLDYKINDSENIKIELKDKNNRFIIREIEGIVRVLTDFSNKGAKNAIYRTGNPEILFEQEEIVNLKNQINLDSRTKINSSLLPTSTYPLKTDEQLKKYTGPATQQGQDQNNNKFVYQGYFQKGEKEGQGTIVSANKHIYTGAFKENKKNGIGKITHIDGEVYEGQFKDNEIIGTGTYTWPDGKQYKGVFEDNKCVNGTIKDKSGILIGTVTKGIYKASVILPKVEVAQKKMPRGFESIDFTNANADNLRELGLEWYILDTKQGYEKAITFFEIALSLNKKATNESKYKLYYNIGISNLYLGQYAKSIESFNKALKNKAKDSESIKHIALAEKLLKNNNEGEQFILEGNNFLSSNNKQEAIKKFEEAIKKFEEIYKENSRDEKIKKLIDSSKKLLVISQIKPQKELAPDLNKLTAEDLKNLGLAQYILGTKQGYEKAIELFKLSLSKATTSELKYKLNYNIGIVSFFLGKYPDAITFFGATINIQNNASALNYIQSSEKILNISSYGVQYMLDGNALLNSDKKRKNYKKQAIIKFEEAIMKFEEAIRENPKDEGIKKSIEDCEKYIANIKNPTQLNQKRSIPTKEKEIVLQKKSVPVKEKIAEARNSKTIKIVNDDSIKGKMAVVDIATLNIRNEKGEVITQLKRGAKVTLTGKKRDNHGIIFVGIEADNNVKGYAAKRYLNISEEEMEETKTQPQTLNQNQKIATKSNFVLSQEKDDDSIKGKSAVVINIKDNSRLNIIDETGNIIGGVKKGEKITLTGKKKIVNGNVFVGIEMEEGIQGYVVKNYLNIEGDEPRINVSKSDFIGAQEIDDSRLKGKGAVVINIKEGRRINIINEFGETISGAKKGERISLTGKKKIVNGTVFVGIEMEDEGQGYAIKNCLRIDGEIKDEMKIEENESSSKKINQRDLKNRGAKNNGKTYKYTQQEIEQFERDLEN